jgi:hypothetical protein
MRFEVLVRVNIKITVFLIVTPCSVVFTNILEESVTFSCINLDNSNTL